MTGKTTLRYLSILLVCLFAATAQLIAQTTGTATAAIPSQLTLRDAMDVMLRQSPILLRDQQNPAIAKGDLIQAGKRPNPDFEISSESYPVFESSPGPFFNNQELLLRAGQTIETAGKRGKRMRVAEQELAATESGVQDTMRQLRFELKRRYYMIVLAKSQRDLAGEILKQFDDIIRLNEARFKQGELSGLEINKIRAERFRFYNDVLDSDLQLKNTKTALLELLGVGDMGTQFDVVETLSAPTLTLDLPQLQTDALQNRPDLRTERQRLERNRQDLRLQKAEAVPNVTPFFGYKRDFGLNTAAFGVSIPLPLFNRNQGGVARATAQIQQQQFETSRLELAARREVQEAYQTVQTQGEKVRALEDQYVPSARNARETAQKSYRLGALDLIGLLDAERTYREAVRGHNFALFDYQTAIFQLETAVGKEF